MIRYYRSGRKAYEYHAAQHKTFYWSPEGQSIESDAFWKLYSAEQPFPDRDARSRHPWPIE